MQRTLFAVIACLLASSASAGERRSATFDGIAEEAFPLMNAPGMAVAVVKGDDLLWAKGYGLADREAGIPVTTRTPFLLVSVTKMVTATALMQLWEHGWFDLDDDVNGYLPFRVRNPAFPDVPITFRMLLSHGSSIGDNWDLIIYYPDGKGVPPLGKSLRAYFNPASPSFDPNRNFLPWAPGTAFSYSNIGYGLIGYLVERLSGQPFDSYVREQILRPLGMQGGFFIRDFKGKDPPLAMPYTVDGATGVLVPYGQYQVWEYPDGDLRTDVVSLSRFLRVLMNGGKVQGHPRILRPSTVQLMHSPSFPDVPGFWGPWMPYYGLGLFINMDWGYGDIAGHDGADYGASTFAYYTTQTNIGVIVLTNGELWASPDYFAIMGDLAGKLTAAALGRGD